MNRIIREIKKHSRNAPSMTSACAPRGTGRTRCTMTDPVRRQQAQANLLSATLVRRQEGHGTWRRRPSSPRGQSSAPPQTPSRAARIIPRGRVPAHYRNYQGNRNNACKRHHFLRAPTPHRNPSSPHAPLVRRARATECWLEQRRTSSGEGRRRYSRARSTQPERRYASRRKAAAPANRQSHDGCQTNTTNPFGTDQRLSSTSDSGG